MFPTRLIRHNDALLMLETFAFLVRRYGLPERPIVPSPLRPCAGIDALVFDSARDGDVYDWARASLVHILEATNTPTGQLTLIASPVPYPQQDDLLSFDPQRASQAGHFTARIILELAENRLRGFETELPLDSHQNAIVRLSTCAFLRQGFVLSHCLSPLQSELSEYGISQRFIENVLVASACLGLSLRRQTPEQMIATYGMVMTRSARRKVKSACRQLDNFDAEIKLLRLFPRALSDRLDVSSAFMHALKPQPQRISWT